MNKFPHVPVGSVITERTERSRAQNAAIAETLRHGNRCGKEEMITARIESLLRSYQRKRNSKCHCGSGKRAKSCCEKPTTAPKRGRKGE